MTLGPRLEGRVAVVTGGASGIGAATATLFALHRARVIVCDSNEAGGTAVAQAIVRAGGDAEFSSLDVREEAQWSALMDTILARFERLDVLANIAGVSGRAPGAASADTEPAPVDIADQSLADWNRIMDVNSTGVFLGTRYAVQTMRHCGNGGSIINISSICGLIGSHSSPAYHASKGAVRLLTKSAALQGAKDRIRVNSVHPGFIDTPMTQGAHAINSVAEERLQSTPLGRFGTSEDIANGCLFLASEESAFVTGSELVIDGGVVTA
jgi:NAD(P)-dependent dehydrogenase (short-subunit alcohol dehydrogenase family)